MTGHMTGEVRLEEGKAKLGTNLKQTERCFVMKGNLENKERENILITSDIATLPS